MEFTLEAIEQIIHDYITTTFLHNRTDVELSGELKLFDRGVIDSMGLIKLIGFLADAFSVKIEPEEVIHENFETLNTMAEFTLAKVAAPGGDGK